MVDPKYPEKTRSAAIGKGFPERSKDARNPSSGLGPKKSGKPDMGHKPKRPLRPRKETK